MLLSSIGMREVPIPEHIDIYHLTREMAPSEKTALQCVMEVDEQRIMLEKEAERLAHEDCEFQQEVLRLIASSFRLSCQMIVEEKNAKGITMHVPDPSV